MTTRELAVKIAELGMLAKELRMAAITGTPINNDGVMASKKGLIAASDEIGEILNSLLQLIPNTEITTQEE